MSYYEKNKQNKMYNIFIMFLYTEPKYVRKLLSKCFTLQCDSFYTSTNTVVQTGQIIFLHLTTDFHHRVCS